MSEVGKINISINSGLSKNIEDYTKSTSQESKNMSKNFTSSTNVGIEELTLEENKEIVGTKTEEPKMIEKIKSGIDDFFESPEDFFSDTAATLGDGINSIVDEIDTELKQIEKNWNNNISPILANGIEKVNTFLERTAATIATGATSLVEGLLNFGESLEDFLIIAGTTAASVVTGIIDLGQAIKGEITGEEWNSLTKKMWEKSKDVVAIEAVKTVFDDMYENTEYGKWLKENSFGFDNTRTLANGLGYTAGIILLAIASGGIGAAILGSAGAATTVGVTSTQLATTAAALGLGKGTQEAWADGAGILEGLGYGSATGIWEGIQFYLGAKIGGSTLFGENGLLLKNLGAEEVTTKLINSLGRVILDGADGGVEGFIQPLLGSIYKDGNYNELFNEYGGWTNVLTQASVGSIMSGVGEMFDGLKGIVKDNNAKIPEEEIPTLDIVKEEITEEITADIIRDYSESDIKVESIIDDIANVSNMSKGKSAQLLQKLISSELDDRSNIMRIAGITDDIQLDRITKKLSDLDSDQIEHYIKENFVTTENRVHPIAYSKKEIKELLGNEQEVIGIIGDTTLTEYGRTRVFEEILDISELVNSGKIELEPIEKQNLDAILKCKSRYISARNNALVDILKHVEKDYDSNTEKLCGYDLETVEKIMNDISKFSSEDTKKYISTIPENNTDALQELKMCSRVSNWISKWNLPVSSNLLKNLELLTDEYYKKISKASQEAVSFANRYGANQNVIDTIFKNEPVTARERLKSAMSGEVNINQDVKNTLYGIVKKYFPTMKKADMKKYLGHINSAGVCSYASVVNGIYNQFARHEDLFRRIFGYDMYKIENGTKHMNDQYLLADLYTYANYNNKNIFDTVNNKTVYTGNEKHTGQVYLSTSSKGVRRDIIEDFINSILNYSEVKMKAEVVGEVAMKYDVDLPLGFRDIERIKDIVIDGLEKNEFMNFGVHTDHQENREFKMYQFNSETGKYDKPYSSKNWVNSDISKEFTEIRRYDGHAMSITGLLKDGIIVSSWGKEYFLPFDEMYKIGITLSKLKLKIFNIGE